MAFSKEIFALKRRKNEIVLELRKPPWRAAPLIKYIKDRTVEKFARMTGKPVKVMIKNSKIRVVTLPESDKNQFHYARMVGR